MKWQDQCSLTQGNIPQDLQSLLKVGVVHANVDHKVTSVNLIPKVILYHFLHATQRAQEDHNTTTTPKNTATMAAKLLAPPVTWS